MSDVLVRTDALERFATALFAGAGVDPAWAKDWAQVLVWANLRGVDSHGVMRIPRYIDLLGAGGIKKHPDLRVEKRSGAIAILEADLAPGPVAMLRAVDEALGRAREVHVGWCAARNITHAGAIGYYALKIAQAGMAGIVVAASSPLMAYHGARVAGVSTNPIAIAVPGGSHPPYLLDMSTSTVSNGKVLNAREAGVAVPPGWGIDAQGRDTTDPAKIATLTPLGGAKGSGLSFMIECLASLALGNPLIAPALERGGKVENPILNAVVTAVDLDAIGDAAAFGREAERFGAAIASLPPAEGIERILLPGERGDLTLAQRTADGVPIPRTTWSRLRATAEKLGVAAPQV